MSYTEFKDGYAKETTFRTSAITGVGDTAYVFGAVSQESVHPSPVAMMKYVATGYNKKEVTAGEVWKANYMLRGMYGLVMQNGVLLWATLGKSSTVGTDTYTHTITPTTDGSKIPSFTINHEQKGSATDAEYQFLGGEIDSLVLIHDMAEAPFLKAKVEWMAAKAQDGIALTNTPALPATANSNAYISLERIWDVGGTPVNIDGLERIEITIINGLRPVSAHTWDGSTYTGMWVQEFIENTRKQYQVRMILHPLTVERRMWDSLISSDTAITATFKWERSANDYIKITVVGPVVEHELKTPAPGEALLEEVVIEPYSMSVEVKDSITGSAYGE